MHDPLVVAFDIPRPWPERSSLPATGSREDGVRWRIRLHHTCCSACVDDPPHRDGAFPWWKPGSYSKFWRLAGREFYWPPLVTVWHREPGGRDALTVCRKTSQRPDGTWRSSRSWVWHVHHWKIQVPPLQEARRRLLTRCTWCGGRSRKRDAVNVRNGWDGPRSPWWRGERGLFHMDCSSVAAAHRACLCANPIFRSSGYVGWGPCDRCGKFRPCGQTAEQMARVRELAAIPPGERRRP